MKKNNNDDLRAALELAKIFRSLHTLSQSADEPLFSDLARDGYEALDRVISYNESVAATGRKQLQDIFGKLKAQGATYAICNATAATGLATLKKI